MELKEQLFADLLQIRCSQKFRNIHKKTPVLQPLFNKVPCLSLKACNFIKKRLWHKCFPVNIANFLRTAFFIKHIWWLLLELVNPFHTSHLFLYLLKTCESLRCCIQGVWTQPAFLCSKLTTETLEQGKKYVQS